MTEEQSTTQETQKPKRDYLLPASILIAAGLISVSLVYNVGKNARPGSGTPEGGVGIIPSPMNVRPVSSDDHILGNPNAPVTVIEFSDLECPFCKNFHTTMHQVISVYGDQVAWVYRHYPLDGLHSKARKAAEASECAAELGGNEKFWKFVDRYFEVTPSNDRIDLAQLPQIATDIGLDKERFESCLAAGTHAARVSRDVSDAQSSGGQGTPYSVVLAKNGDKFTINGAYPFDAAPGEPSVKAIIDQALR